MKNLPIHFLSDGYILFIFFVFDCKQERLKLEQEINNFRRTYQKKEDRREFDLNDPDQIKKQLPARLHDDDPRCGPSSAQK